MPSEHIPHKTASVLGTQHEEKVDEQHEIDMHNINMSNANHIPLARVGACVVPVSLQYEEVMHTLGLALGRKGFLVKCKMEVLPKMNPNMNGFASL